MKFTHGQRVTCKIYGTEIKDANISIDSDGTPFICQNLRDGVRASDKLGYKYSWVLNKDFTDDDVTDLKPLHRTIDDIQEGDVVVVDKDGNERMVLGVCGKVFFMSIIDDFSMCNAGFTIEELKNKGYKLKDEQEVEEMTLAEVCKELGREVKIRK